MRLVKLGTSELMVSECCLGTMTFGEQNSEAEAHAQLDLALHSGVNFIDTAEIYPAPLRAETQGRTETIIGSWLRRRARDKVVLATKIAGPRETIDWLRGTPMLTREQVIAACEDSLRRLQTHYIDLYQVHWPSRAVPLFGEFTFNPQARADGPAIEETLEALTRLKRDGKVREIGLSNETPWGVSQYLQLARDKGFARIAAIQNAYSLLNRTFEWGLAEYAYREQIPLIAYSPLAFGHLSGKYQRGTPRGSRIDRYPEFAKRYVKPNIYPAVSAYLDIAKSLNCSAAQLAIAFVKSRWFVCSTIIGASTLAQLNENLGAFDLTLSKETLDALDVIHQRFTNPAP